MAGKSAATAQKHGHRPGKRASGDPFGDTLVDPDTVAPPEHDYDIVSNEYGFYSLPRSFRKRELPTVLTSGHVYEPNTLKFMQRMAGQGDIVSGGALVGDFFPALSGALARDARLHSFEPNPVSYESARHTIALNGLENVCLTNAAVGEVAGVLPLQVSRSGKNALAAGAKIVRSAQEGATIDVRVTPLDDLIPQDRRISILHLDIEGHEMAALLGARSMIARNRPIIILEAEKVRVQRTYMRLMRNRFAELRYRIAGKIERNVIFVSEMP